MSYISDQFFVLCDIQRFNVFFSFLKYNFVNDAITFNDAREKKTFHVKNI